MASKMTDKQALLHWEKLRSQIRSATPVDMSESLAAQRQRKARLEADWEAFCLYYFPNWVKSPFSKYHRQVARAYLSGKYKRIALVAFRGFSKTTFFQMLDIYEAMTERMKFSVWANKVKDGGANFVTTIKVQFEENNRLIHDYGPQRNVGMWEDDFFVLRNGVAFRAIGRGQSPRGMKYGETRPDRHHWDDMDDDQSVLSDEQIDKQWDWLIGALYPTVNIDDDFRVVMAGNLISENSLLARFIEHTAEYVKQVDLLDKQGRPTWPERFTKKICMEMVSSMPMHLSQREYFNNPIKPGKVFKKDWVQWKKLPPLQQYQYVVAYLDPSFSDKKNADHKAWILVGLWKGEVHVVKAWCDVASVDQMVSWGYEIDAYLKSRNAAAMLYMEEVFLQSLLYKDFQAAAKKHGFQLPLKGDARKKPAKDVRIAAQSGKFERGAVYFNEAERGNHHMQNLVDQFLLFQMGNTRVKKDGPDAYEGAVHILEQMVFQAQPVVWGNRKSHNKRF